MELFYNPERMSEREIRDTFVAHQWLIDEIVSIIRQQPKGAGVQHIVIVAPRGMGKTTILLMLRFSLLNGELVKKWQPILFPEESYGIYDLADLWLEVLNHISAETGEVRIAEEVWELKIKHPVGSELGETALAKIKEWTKENKKRLIMLIDNFDMILEQIGDERDNASLREVLINDGTMMLIGGATTFFKEARAYDQPLYNLFKIYNLDCLNSEQILELLRRRAKVDGRDDFEEILRANASRLRVLEYFTGGNPRLVLMLYRVLIHSQISELRRGLEKLLDEVTPYYKAKVEMLPPQQRKLLDHIARITARTREGLTPTEIAAATRLAVNQVSSQLKRLGDLGYVSTADIRGRSSYYTLSEPLYAIWHQMRFGRDARKRMSWLVTFLKGWYDAEGINSESQRLQEMFRNYVSKGLLSEARDALEYSRYLVDAIDSRSDRTSRLESIINCYLDLKDIETLKSDVLSEINPLALSEATQERLAAEGLLDAASVTIGKRVESKQRAKFAEALQSAEAAFNGGQFHEAITNFRRAIDINPASFSAQIEHAVALAFLGSAKESVEALKMAERYFIANSAFWLSIRALRALFDENFDDAASNLNKLEKNLAKSQWMAAGQILKYLSRFDQALRAFSYVTELDQNAFEAWYARGDTLDDLKRYEEALESFDRALQIIPDSYEALHGRGFMLWNLGRNLEAVSALEEALKIKPESIKTWLILGASRFALKNFDDALVCFDKVTLLNPAFYQALCGKIACLELLGRHEEALTELDNLMKADLASPDDLYIRGLVLGALNKQDDSLDHFRQAFSPGKQGTVINTSQALSIKLMMSLSEGNLEKAKSDWQALREAAQREGGEGRWLEIASQSLREATLFGNWPFVRKLIDTSDLEEPLFPLARALDYLMTGDETLIEKLSPEVRRIVENIVDTLNKQTKNNGLNQKVRTKYSQPKPKRKTK